MLLILLKFWKAQTNVCLVTRRTWPLGVGVVVGSVTGGQPALIGVVRILNWILGMVEEMVCQGLLADWIVVAVVAGMTMVMMDGLAGLGEVAVGAVAEVTVIGIAEVLRGHAVIAVAGPGVGAEAGAGATLGTVVLAAAGAVALVLAVGMKEALLALGLHCQTLGTVSAKEHQKLTHQETIQTTQTRKMTDTQRMGRWERLISIGRLLHKTSLAHIVLLTMEKPVAQ